jgi:RNA ligase (TIGR02306 family)
MSLHKVPLTTIKSLEVHPNADRLEIARIYDFLVVTQKGRYKVGDEILFIPPDSIVPVRIQEILFPPDSKIKLTKSRVRQIRIRKVASQGMIVNPKDILPADTMLLLENDYSEILGITKYDPPDDYSNLQPKQAKPRNKPKENPMFHKYNGIENFKWFPDLFQEGEEVVFQEKLHGTNSRYAKLPTVVDSLWKRIKKLFGRLPEFETCHGSNNVQLQGKEYSGFYEEDVYHKILRQEDIETKLKPYETIYGEIIGPGIQKDYHYGITQGQHKFVLFDVKKYDGEHTKFLTPSEVEAFAKERGFEMIPILYRGPFKKELAYWFAQGPSVYAPSQKIREGIVVKSAIDVTSNITGKKMLKIINEAYLDGDQSDGH